jgi:hypothetical protein
MYLMRLCVLCLGSTSLCMGFAKANPSPTKPLRSLLSALPESPFRAIDAKRPITDEPRPCSAARLRKKRQMYGSLLSVRTDCYRRLRCALGLQKRSVLLLRHRASRRRWMKTIVMTETYRTAKGALLAARAAALRWHGIQHPVLLRRNKLLVLAYTRASRQAHTSLGGALIGACAKPSARHREYWSLTDSHPIKRTGLRSSIVADCSTTNASNGPTRARSLKKLQSPGPWWRVTTAHVSRVCSNSPNRRSFGFGR